VWTQRHDSRRVRRPDGSRAAAPAPRAPRDPVKAAADRAAAAAASRGGSAPRAAYGSRRPVGGGGKPGRSTVSLKMLMVGGGVNVSSQRNIKNHIFF
jgi:hypothetical protein